MNQHRVYKFAPEFSSAGDSVGTEWIWLNAANLSEMMKVPLSQSISYDITYAHIYNESSLNQTYGHQKYAHANVTDWALTISVHSSI